MHYQNDRVSPWRFWLEIAACRESLVECWGAGVSRDEKCREDKDSSWVKGFMNWLTGRGRLAAKLSMP